MARCIDDNNKKCEYLKWNQKGNCAYHCNYNSERLVQICDEDVRANIPCPLDVYKKKEE